MTALPAHNLTGPRLRRSTWPEHYQHRHGYVRLRNNPALPNGRRGRVTIYQRGQEAGNNAPQTYILAWCDHGRRHKERVLGDVYDAVRRADEINTAISTGTGAGQPGSLTGEELVGRFIDWLRRRADAGDVSPKTPERYRGALQHLVTFIETDVQRRQDDKGWIPTGDFALRFKAYLHGIRISPNGHARTARRPLLAKGIEFILGTARALVRWATHEGYLPDAAADAFAHVGRQRRASPAMSNTPIRTEEVIAFVQAADLYQLALFSFHIFHGARVAESCWVMIEFIDTTEGWIEYRCIDELGYRTKGGTNKRLPVPPAMMEALALLTAGRAGGPINLKRRRALGDADLPERRRTFRDMVKTVEGQSPANWSQRVRAGIAGLKQAGGIDGDTVRREFTRMVRQAGLRDALGPKSLRHHFATALERADVPYYTRKYLLGHTPSARGGHGNDPTAIYTHLEPDLVKAGYQRLLDGPLAKVAEAFAERIAELKAAKSSPPSIRRP
jgi:hypothetical protein